MENLESLLEHLDINELKELVNDEDVFSNFTKEAAASVTKDYDEQKQMLIASNKSLAEFNLSQESNLLEKKSQLKVLSDEVAGLTKSVEEKVEKLKTHRNNVTADTVLALLQTAAAETEEESEKIAEEFLSGSIDLDKFLEHFAPQRMLMHMRRVKADKMTDMLTKRSSYSSPAGNMSNGYTGGLPRYPALPSGGPGYPMGGGSGMPLPNLPMAPYPHMPAMPKPYF